MPRLIPHTHTSHLLPLLPPIHPQGYWKHSQKDQPVEVANIHFMREEGYLWDEAVAMVLARSSVTTLPFENEAESRWREAQVSFTDPDILPEDNAETIRGVACLSMGLPVHVSKYHGVVPLPRDDRDGLALTLKAAGKRTMPLSPLATSGCLASELDKRFKYEAPTPKKSQQ
jgi:hypothetical protein